MNRNGLLHSMQAKTTAEIIFSIINKSSTVGVYEYT